MIFVFLTTFGQNRDQLISKEFVKTNGIKSIKQYSHLISNGKVTKKWLIKSQHFDENGNLIESYEKDFTSPTRKYNYDSAENLIEKIVYKPDGSKYEIYTWEYDSNGRILKYIIYWSWNKETPFTDNYVYDEQGRNVEIYEIGNQGKKSKISTMKYYDSGELFEKRFENKEVGFVRVERFDKCSNLIYKSEYGEERIITIKYIDSCKVDISDKILQTDTIHYIENGKELMKVTELWLDNKRNIKTVDNNGNRIISERYEYYADSTLRYSNISFFNEQGQVIESKTFYSVKEFIDSYHGKIPPDAPDTKYHSKYEYYDNGLKKIEYNFNEKGVKIRYEEHKIEYY